MKTYIKALKKSINQERFLIRVAGLEYEVAQKLPQAAPIQENCGPGWERDGSRCGKTARSGAESSLAEERGREEQVLGVPVTEHGRSIRTTSNI